VYSDAQSVCLPDGRRDRKFSRNLLTAHRFGSGPTLGAIGLRLAIRRGKEIPP
jgi:hypothetical protein